MNVQFLGTGGVLGIPYWNCGCEVCSSKDSKDTRLRPSLLVKIGKKNVLIDFGPDLRRQLLKYKIKKIDYAFLTHAHSDHMNGFSDFASQKKFALEAPRAVLFGLFKWTQEIEWMQTRNPTMEIRPFKKKVVNGVEIDTVKLDHKKGYEKIGIPCVGYTFSTKNFKMAYLTDYINILEEDKVKNLDVLISDGNGFNPSNRGHVGIKRNIKLYKKLKPKKMILTHINHVKSHSFLTKYVKKFGNIHIAYDGMKFDL